MFSPKWGLIALFFITLSNGFLRAGDLQVKKEFQIIGQGTNGPYFVGEKNLIENSEIVSCDSLLLIKNKDYWIDYKRGEVNFAEPLGLEETLQISYSSQLIALKKRYFQRELVFNSEINSTLPQVVENKPSFSTLKIPEPNLNLRLQGNKTFAVQMNSAQNFSLQQSLNLALAGQITSDVEIKALLSDQNLPVSSDGNTKRFDELDKLSLSLSSSVFNAVLGDIQQQAGEPVQSNQLSGYQFFSYSKRLKGVQSSYNKGNLGVDVTVADSKGRNSSFQFYGEDGKQGPYLLKTTDGKAMVNIIPASEKVWLDGKLLTRGSDYDYTIDYEQGFIVFTPKQIITSQSQILVDFEYSNENYATDFFSSRANIKLNEGKFVLGATVVNEKEDRNSPNGFSLTAEDKLILKQAGDNSHQAYHSGIQYVGENQGSYNKATDSLGNEFYHYAGPNLGAYSVSFSYVGYKQGSYQNNTSGGFLYVYPQNGDYLPIVYLPLPQNQSVIATDLSYAPSENLQLKAEYAKSLKDKNTLSGLDENDNAGEALVTGFNFQQKDFNFLSSHWSHVKSQASLRIISQNFSSLGRSTPVERQHNWNLPLNLKSGSERSFEISNQISPKDRFSLNFDFGSIKSGEFFSAARENYGITFPFFFSGKIGLTQQNVNINEIVSDSASSLKLSNKRNQTRNQITLRQLIKGMGVNASFEKEENQATTLNISNNQTVRKFKIRVSDDNFKGTSFATEFFQRKSSGNSFYGNSTLQIWQSQASIKNWKQVINSNLEFTTQSNQIPNQKTQTTNLASVRVDISPPSQVTFLELRYLINQSGVAQNNFLKLDSSNGQYNYADSQTVRLSDPNNFLSATLFTKSVHWVFSPYKLNKSQKNFWDSILSAFYTDTYLTLEEHIPGQNYNWSNWFLPWGNLKADSILIKNYSFQQEVNFTPSNHRHFFKFKWGKTLFENHLYSTGKISRHENLQGLSGNFNLGKNLFLQSEQSWSSKEQNLSGYVNYQVKGQQTGFTLTRKNFVITEISGGSLYAREKEKISQISSLELGFKLKLAHSVSNRGRVISEAKWSEVSFSPKVTNVWYLAGGKKSGGNWELNLNLNYKISQNFNYLVTYQSQSNSYFRNKNLFRMELRANF